MHSNGGKRALTRAPGRSRRHSQRVACARCHHSRKSFDAIVKVSFPSGTSPAILSPSGARDRQPFRSMPSGRTSIPSLRFSSGAWVAPVQEGAQPQLSAVNRPRAVRDTATANAAASGSTRSRRRSRAMGRKRSWSQTVGSGHKEPASKRSASPATGELSWMTASLFERQLPPLVSCWALALAASWMAFCSTKSCRFTPCYQLRYR